MVRGESAEACAKALGCSVATIKRRRKELRSGVPAARAESRASAAAASVAKTETKLPDPEAEIAEDTPLQQIDEWLRLAEAEVAAASSTPGAESDTVAKMVRLAAMLLALKVKATPPAPADPNANPDFVAAAERVRKRWHALLDKSGCPT